MEFENTRKTARICLTDQRKKYDCFAVYSVLWQYFNARETIKQDFSMFYTLMKHDILSVYYNFEKRI